jgi:hypothetical protein
LGYLRSQAGQGKEKKKMADEQQIWASHKKVEQFVSKLKEFHSSLNEGG